MGYHWFVSQYELCSTEQKMYKTAMTVQANVNVYFGKIIW